MTLARAIEDSYCTHLLRKVWLRPKKAKQGLQWDLAEFGYHLGEVGRVEAWSQGQRLGDVWELLLAGVLAGTTEGPLLWGAEESGAVILGRVLRGAREQGKS